MSASPQGGITFTTAGMMRGARVSVPLLIGLVPFGLVAGVTAQAHGLSLLEAILMSGLVFAGSSQLVALGSWTHPVSLAAATLAVFIVNLRFALMGPMLAPWLDHLRGWRRWGSLALLVEHDWALALKEISAGGRDAAFFFGAGASMWVAWEICTVAGFLVGAAVAPAAGHPLFFAALACFITMLVPMWRGRKDLLPWIAAAGTAILVSKLLPGTSWHIIAGALVGGLTGYFRDRSASA